MLTSARAFACAFRHVLPQRGPRPRGVPVAQAGCGDRHGAGHRRRQPGRNEVSCCLGKGGLPPLAGARASTAKVSNAASYLRHAHRGAPPPPRPPPSKPKPKLMKKSTFRDLGLPVGSSDEEEDAESEASEAPDYVPSSAGEARPGACLQSDLRPTTHHRPDPNLSPPSQPPACRAQLPRGPPPRPSPPPLPPPLPSAPTSSTACWAWGAARRSPRPAGAGQGRRGAGLRPLPLPPRTWTRSARLPVPRTAPLPMGRRGCLGGLAKSGDGTGVVLRFTAWLCP